MIHVDKSAVFGPCDSWPGDQNQDLNIVKRLLALLVILDPSLYSFTLCVWEYFQKLVRELQLPGTPGSTSGYDGDISDDPCSGWTTPDAESKSEVSDSSYHSHFDTKTNCISQPLVRRRKSSVRSHKVRLLKYSTLMCTNYS